MPKKLFISDERMLQLMQWAVDNRIVETETEYWEKIDFARTSISNVKAGTQGFRNYHIYNACRLTGASADYIFGFTNNLLRKPLTRPIDLLKQAVHAVDEELRAKKSSVHT